MSKKPNLLILHTDQQSCWTLSIYGGGGVLETPNIDFIGKEGVMFNNFFANSALCSPSRGCFLTGRYPYSNGMYRNDLKFNDDEITLAHILSQNGYDAAYFGKWHLDGRQKPGWVKPENRMGFKDAVMWNRGHWKSIIEREGSKYPDVSMEVGKGAYPTDWIADKTIEYLEKPRDNPFFIMASFPDPHHEFCVRAPFDSMFKPEDMPVPETFHQENRPGWVEELPKKFVTQKSGIDEEKFKQIKAQYCGEVKCIDYNVGRILDCLSKQGVLDDTIIIFTSDHGEYMGEHGMMLKNHIYETAYRVPMLMRWPGKIPAGTEVEELVDIVDFQQTILGLMDVEPCGREQGFDASSLILGKNIEWTNEVFLYHCRGTRAGIFTDEYELAFIEEGGSVLFDRINDPQQINNLFNKPDYKNVVKELGLRVIKHFREHDNPEMEWLANIEKEILNDW